jgi:ABC-type sulfate transport system substrate-binding protein
MEKRYLDSRLAREARTQFETGYGDALVTYELEGLMMKQAGADVDVIVPKATIFSEHPAVIIDRNVTAAERPVVQAFVNFLWTDEAQKAFVKYYFRSVTNEGIQRRELAVREDRNAVHDRDVRRLGQSISRSDRADI